MISWVSEIFSADCRPQESFFPRMSFCNRFICSWICLTDFQKDSVKYNNLQMSELVALKSVQLEFSGRLTSAQQATTEGYPNWLRAGMRSIRREPLL